MALMAQITHVCLKKCKETDVLLYNLPSPEISNSKIISYFVDVVLAKNQIVPDVDVNPFSNCIMKFEKISYINAHHTHAAFFLAS